MYVPLSLSRNEININASSPVFFLQNRENLLYIILLLSLDKIENYLLIYKTRLNCWILYKKVCLTLNKSKMFTMRISVQGLEISVESRGEFIIANVCTQKGHINFLTLKKKFCSFLTLLTLLWSNNKLSTEVAKFSAHFGWANDRLSARSEIEKLSSAERNSRAGVKQPKENTRFFFKSNCRVRRSIIYNVITPEDVHRSFKPLNQYWPKVITRTCQDTVV